MMLLSDEEVNRIAWRLLLNGAESMAEDWIDEDGDFTEEDSDRIYSRQMELLKELKATVEMLLDG